jgi:glycosyltransferase involved in cell wall biosynthesis
MKILIFNSLDYGGAARSVKLLAKGLKEFGHEPVLVYTGTRDRITHIDGIKTYYLKITNVYDANQIKKRDYLNKAIWHFLDCYNIFNKKSILKIITDEQPDVVHTNILSGFSPIVWKIAKKANIAVAHTLRCYYLLCPHTYMFNPKTSQNCPKQCLKCRLYSKPKKYQTKYVDAVVGVSKDILDRVLSYKLFSKTKNQIYIYNPVKEVSDIPKDMFINKNLKFGFVGNFTPEKGLEQLLQAFEKIENPNIYLVQNKKQKIK